MNETINAGTRRLHKWLLAVFVFLTFVQVVFGHQHRSSFLDSWNIWLTIAGFVFSLPRAFPVLVESPFYGMLSFLLRVRSWIPMMLCLLLVASLGVDLFLPNSQRISRTGQPVPGSTPGISETSGPTPSTGGEPSSPGSVSPTPVPTLSSSGTPAISDPMVAPASTDPWDVINQPNVKCNFVNGTYDINILPQQIAICKTEGANSNLSNFIYEITMTIVRGSGNAGIVFRHESTSSPTTDLDQQPPMTDLLLFDQQGNYTLAVVGSSGHQPITKTGRCYSFHRGLKQSNQIDVQVMGQNIDVFVNGVYLTSIQDDQLTSGHMGVMLMSGDNISEATYSNLNVWKLG